MSSTHALPLAGRRGWLAAGVLALGGEWTTARVLDLYRTVWPGARRRRTARGDLEALAAAGLLTRQDGDGRRTYLPAEGAREWAVRFEDGEVGAPADDRAAEESRAARYRENGLPAHLVTRVCGPWEVADDA